jgi:phosphohistidine phosphatase
VAEKMSQKLYLLRHAEAEPWSPLVNDFSRPLSRHGIRHANLLSNWVQESLPPPDTVLCSPARRTRETLAPILSHWRKLLATTDYIESMYGASLHLLLTLIEDAFSYSESLLMVGHNPGVAALLINILQKNQATAIQPMATGTFAVIEFPADFRCETQNGNLLHLIQRNDLSVD